MTTKTIKPQRTCVGCKKKFEQNDLLAITRLKNGEMVVNKDQAQKGRSVYLCFKKECLAKAKDRKGKSALEFGLKVKIPENIWEELQKEIQK